MELLISILIGILFAIGTYMMLSRKLLRIIIGSAFMSHGTLLMLMTVGKLKRAPRRLWWRAWKIRFMLTRFRRR